MPCALQLLAATTQHWQLLCRSITVYRGPVCCWDPRSEVWIPVMSAVGNALWSPFLAAAYLYPRCGKWRPDSNVPVPMNQHVCSQNLSCRYWTWGRILRTWGAAQQSFRGANFRLDAFTWQEFWFICALEDINCNLKYLLWDTNIGFTAWILLRSLGWVGLGWVGTSTEGRQEMKCCQQLKGEGSFRHGNTSILTQRNGGLNPVWQGWRSWAECVLRLPEMFPTFCANLTDITVHRTAGHSQPFMSHINPLHTYPSRSYNIHFNIILPYA